MAAPLPARRYRFGDFTLCPSRRALYRGSAELPLIPRYFDLLLLLVERRQEAVHRRTIFDTVWSDVIVSDSALTQAVRILRRTLGDDPREPRFIRTVSRHGYRFVHPEVHEEADEGAPELSTAAPQPAVPTPPSSAADEVETALETLLRPGMGTEDDEAARLEAAVALHQSKTANTLARLD